MNPRAEGDLVKTLSPVEAYVIGDDRRVLIPDGSVGTVVLVFGPPISPEAYEVEFYIPLSECYALATVEAASLSAD